MRAKPVVFILALIAFAVCLFFVRSSDDSPSRSNLRSLSQQQRQASRLPEDSSEDSGDDDIDLRASQGMGMAVPDDLVVRPVDGGYWFVGKRGSESGVEIPFAPGRFPKKKEGLVAKGKNPGFLGADACRDCHEQKHASFVHTAHHLTSQRADKQTIAGSFRPESNQLKTANANVNFTMLERDGRFLQRVQFFDWNFEVPFDLITGSSKMAQSYLYWHRDELYQMNVTYLSKLDAWINSPGYVDGDAAYARPIPSRCLDCHTTYVDFREPPNHYTPETLITGISCERCHGPGKAHVDYHRAHPEDKKARHTVVPSKLPRKQQLDVCSQCHSGLSPLKGDPFAFRPGDALDDHYESLDPEELANSVHTSNQVSRLSKSECFKQTEMTCVDCHNPHKNERGQMALFSKRCLQCHAAEHPEISQLPEVELADNCVDCHMPQRASNKLRFETAEASIFPYLRDHFIRVDEKATQDYVQWLQQQSGSGQQRAN